MQTGIQLAAHMMGSTPLHRHEMPYEEREVVEACRRAIALQYPELNPADVNAALPSQKLLKFAGMIENWMNA